MIECSTASREKWLEIRAVICEKDEQKGIRERIVVINGCTRRDSI